MITREENERLTRIEGDAPMGRLMRENYWIPFALSSHLVPGQAPTLVRLFGENYVAFRAEDGRGCSPTGPVARALTARLDLRATTAALNGPAPRSRDSRSFAKASAPGADSIE